MKYTLKIDNQTYTVEIGDLHTRPIIATIDGEQFEVWPESEQGHSTITAQQNGVSHELPRQTSPLSPLSLGAPVAPPDERSKVVRAPIPGTITDILVKVGQPVTVGQPLCVLDAMKMSNTIYAARSGTIANVAITVGQHVKHSDVMITYAD